MISDTIIVSNVISLNVLVAAVVRAHPWLQV